MAINNYKQYDRRWNTKPYAGESLNNAGCATCMTANTSKKSTPPDTADWLTEHGYASDGHGTYWEGPPAFWKADGENGKQLNYVSLYGVVESAVFTTFKKHIQSGYCGGLLMGPGYWTGGGHYISIVGYSKRVDKYLVHDPANKDRDGWHSWSDFAGVIKVAYTNSERWADVEPIVWATVGTAVCTENGVNFRDAPNGNIIGHLDAGDTVELDGNTDGAWTHVRLNEVLIGWVASQYLKASYNYYEFVFKDVYKGCKNAEATRLVQILLSSMHIYDGRIDSDPGPGTDAAIRKFQQIRALSVTGKIQAVDKAALTNLVNNGKQTFRVRRIRKGDEGDSVVFLQRILKVLGYYNGAIDGDFGPGTDASVRWFQSKNNLKVDGDVFTDTWKALLLL